MVLWFAHLLGMGAGTASGVARPTTLPYLLAESGG